MEANDAFILSCRCSKPFIAHPPTQKGYVLLLGVFFFLFTFAAFCQQRSIGGTVRSLGAVPSVTITVMHTETSTARTFYDQPGRAVCRSRAPDWHYTVAAIADIYEWAQLFASELSQIQAGWG